MSYSLNTLNSSQSAYEQTATARFAQEVGLILGALVLVFWLLALLSYSGHDAAWSTSGAGASTLNWGGRLGAWLSDASYYFFGFSIWWCVAALARAWLATLATWMRSGEGHVGLSDLTEHDHVVSPRVKFWFGLVLLMSSSVAVEWARLHRLELYLPGHAGGVLGYLLGISSVKLLGYTGAALACKIGRAHV